MLSGKGGGGRGGGEIFVVERRKFHSDLPLASCFPRWDIDRIIFYRDIGHAGMETQFLRLDRARIRVSFYATENEIFSRGIASTGSLIAGGIESVEMSNSSVRGNRSTVEYSNSPVCSFFFLSLLLKSKLNLVPNDTPHDDTSVTGNFRAERTIIVSEIQGGSKERSADALRRANFHVGRII